MGDHFGIFHILLLDPTFMLDDTLIQAGSRSLYPTQGSNRAQEQLLQPHNLGALFHGLWNRRIRNNVRHLDCLFHERRNRNVTDLLMDPLSDLYLWNLLYFHLFQYRMKLHDVLCRLSSNDKFLIGLTDRRQEK